MADRIETDLIVRAIAEGFDKVNQEQRKIGDEAKKQKSNLDKLKEAWLKVGTAIVTARAAVAAIRKIWDFAEEGAQVRQMGESWDLLTAKLDAPRDLLDQLKVASRGTIGEMQLMTSTATLLAGTSDELGAKLAEATPQLLEIAKAANKLNPSLGDTAFLYESIATGVKRASPLILDNLGLTVKVGQANEAMAKQLGKAVTELTAEEKSMALLEETMRAGENIIRQVGGTTESAADSFARLKTQIQDSADSFKEATFDALGPFFKEMADRMETVDILNTLLDLGAISMVDFIEAMDDAKQTGWDEALKLANEELLVQKERLSEVDAAMGPIDQKLLRLVGLYEDTGEAAGDASKKMKKPLDVLKDYSNEAIGATVVTGMLRDAMADEFISDKEVRAIRAVAASFGTELPESLGESITNFNRLSKEGIDPAKADADDLYDAIIKSVALDGSEINLYVKWHQEGSPPGGGGGGGGGDGPPSSSTPSSSSRTGTSGLAEFQHGGRLPRSGVYSVGERGWEFVIDGVVVPHSMSRRLAALGLRPGSGFALEPGAGNIAGPPPIGGAPSGMGGIPESAGSGGSVTRPSSGGGGTTSASTDATTAGTVHQAASEGAAAVTIPAVKEAVQSVASTVGASSEQSAQQIRTIVQRQIQEQAKSLEVLNQINRAIDNLPDPIADATVAGFAASDLR